MQKRVRKVTSQECLYTAISIKIVPEHSVFQQQGKNSKAFSFWRNKVQRAIQSAKSNYFHSKVADVDRINPVKWWKEIKKLSGQNVRQEWYRTSSLITTWIYRIPS
jgi:hypothetical protein